jgi:lipopolysaccharide heptosyltransferase II
MRSSLTLPDSLTHILAIRLDNIGDVVMTGPALRALRAAYPAAQITLMASPGGSQAAPLLPWIDQVFTWRASWQDIGPQARVDPDVERSLVAQLAEGQYAAAFIFTSFSQSPYPPAYACALAEIPIRVGQSREFGGTLLTHWVKPLPDSVHQVERNLHLLRAAGLKVTDSHLALEVPIIHRQRAESRLAGLGINLTQGWVSLVPGASAAARRYPDEKYAQAAGEITRAAGLPVLVLGSEREVNVYPLLEKRAALDPGVISLIGKTTLPEMATIISGSRLVIANNSAAMHIAAAFQRPMVILFSGTELLSQWAPDTQPARFLYRPVGCSPCHNFQCPYALECLDVPPSEVVQNALDLLEAVSAQERKIVTHPTQEEPNGR